MKYSDLLAEWLVEAGYTHCFSVAGGNIMHLLESLSRELRCVPVVHEVAAGIAAEYFNEVSDGARALALVTAGPGLTNIVTALAGAYLESRDLLVIGGQVKRGDLARGQVRQRGIQEIDGTAIAAPVTGLSERLLEPVDRAGFMRRIDSGSVGRPAPVFLEIPLDVQACDVDREALCTVAEAPRPRRPEGPTEADLARLGDRIHSAARPVLLVGGGVSRQAAEGFLRSEPRVPLMTTWNGADRIPSDHAMFFGRPNTWGQRYANLLIQQADLVVALGTRLGLQQTGFNWEEFVPVGDVVQVDCDPTELHKGHPRVAWPLLGDAGRVLEHLADTDLGRHEQWVDYCREAKRGLPLSEACNTTRAGHVSPYEFVLALSRLCTPRDVVIPCSSGGAFTGTMQSFEQKAGQRIVTNKGLASMGYGLSGAIGAALASPGRRTLLIAGDGGFIQNAQELGTARANELNLKIFLFDDGGYASIRMTQRNYFDGHYVACDRATGVGLPDWELLFRAYGIPALRLTPDFESDASFREAFEKEGVVGFVVPIDPEQTWYPKITSRVVEGGGMRSNPLHRMTPDLDPEILARHGRYLPREDRS